MRIIRDVSGFCGVWLNGLVPHGVKDGALAMAVIDDNDDLIAVVAVADRNAANCTISVAASDVRWARKHILTELFTAFFEELGHNRLTCLVSTDNARSLKLTRGLGWREEGVLRGAGSDGEDLVLFGMLKDECEYLRPAIPPQNEDDAPAPLA